jgi:hypothetical protein
MGHWKTYPNNPEHLLLEIPCEGWFLDLKTAMFGKLALPHGGQSIPREARPIGGPENCSC